MSYRVIYSNSLMHHGIKGQKWGVRRYQNSDGTWTEEGKKRRNNEIGDYWNQYGDRVSNNKKMTKGQKALLSIGAGIAAGAIITYGAYKINQINEQSVAGLKEEYGKKAVENMFRSYDLNKMASDSIEFAEQAKLNIKDTSLREASENLYKNQASRERQMANEAANAAKEAADKAKYENFGLKEKIDYIARQRKIKDNKNKA